MKSKIIKIKFQSGQLGCHLSIPQENCLSKHHHHDSCLFDKRGPEILEKHFQEKEKLFSQSGNLQVRIKRVKTKRYPLNKEEELFMGRATFDFQGNKQILQTKPQKESIFFAVNDIMTEVINFLKQS